MAIILDQDTLITTLLVRTHEPSCIALSALYLEDWAPWKDSLSHPPGPCDMKLFAEIPVPHSSFTLNFLMNFPKS